MITFFENMDKILDAPFSLGWTVNRKTAVWPDNIIKICTIFGRNLYSQRRLEIIKRKKKKREKSFVR